MITLEIKVKTLSKIKHVYKCIKGTTCFEIDKRIFHNIIKNKGVLNFDNTADFKKYINVLNENKLKYYIK
jgi:hypothetical protein